MRTKHLNSALFEKAEEMLTILLAKVLHKSLSTYRSLLWEVVYSLS